MRLTPAADATPAACSPAPPRYQHDGALTPKDASGMFYAVNTMQPPYQPSGVAPAAGRRRALRRSEPSRPTLPPQTQATIGDRLDAKGVAWAWYGGAWNAAGAGTPEARAVIYKRQGATSSRTTSRSTTTPHFDPATHAAYRAAHLKDFDSRLPRRRRRRPAARR